MRSPKNPATSQGEFVERWTSSLTEQTGLARQLWLTGSHYHRTFAKVLPLIRLIPIVSLLIEPRFSTSIFVGDDGFFVETVISSSPEKNRLHASDPIVFSKVVHRQHAEAKPWHIPVFSSGDSLVPWFIPSFARIVKFVGFLVSFSGVHAPMVL